MPVQDQLKLTPELRDRIIRARQSATSTQEFDAAIAEILASVQEPEVKDPDLAAYSEGQGFTPKATRRGDLVPGEEGPEPQQALLQPQEPIPNALAEGLQTWSDGSKAAAKMLSDAAKWTKGIPGLDKFRPLLGRRFVEAVTISEALGMAAETVRTEPRGTYPYFETLGQAGGVMLPALAMGPSAPGVAVGAALFGSAFFPEAIGGYEQALADGMTEDQATAMFYLYGAGAAGIEQVGGAQRLMLKWAPVGKAIERINKATGGSMSWVINAYRKQPAALQAAEEEQGEEYLNQILYQILAEAMTDEDIDHVAKFTEAAEEMGLKPAFAGSLLGGGMQIAQAEMQEGEQKERRLLDQRERKKRLLHEEPDVAAAADVSAEQLRRETLEAKAQADLDAGKLGEVQRDFEEAQELREDLEAPEKIAEPEVKLRDRLIEETEEELARESVSLDIEDQERITAEARKSVDEYLREKGTRKPTRIGDDLHEPRPYMVYRYFQDPAEVSKDKMSSFGKEPDDLGSDFVIEMEVPPGTPINAPTEGAEHHNLGDFRTKVRPERVAKIVVPPHEHGSESEAALRKRFPNAELVRVDENGIAVEVRQPQEEVEPQVAEAPELADTKVVDEKGSPKVVYHGTEAEGFTKPRAGSWFSEHPDEASAYGSARSLVDRQRLRDQHIPVTGPKVAGRRVPYVGIIADIPSSAKGKVWATDQGVVRVRGDGRVEVFTDLVVEDGSIDEAGDTIVVRAGKSDAFDVIQKDVEDYIASYLEGGEGGRVYPVTLDIRNPKELSALEANELSERLGGDPKKTAAYFEELKEQGYDGIKTTSDEATLSPDARSGLGGVPVQWIPFDESQIKSALSPEAPELEIEEPEVQEPPTEEPPPPPKEEAPEPTFQAEPTSIKNEVVDREREKRGLPPAMEPARRSFGQSWDTAMDQIVSQAGVQDALVEELRESPRAVTDIEDALLLHRQVELQNEYDKITRALSNPTNLDSGQIAELESVEDYLANRLLELYDINKAVGTATGRGLAARKMLANEDFSLAAMLSKKRRAKQVQRLSSEDSEAIKETNRKLNELQRQLDEATAELERKQATDQVEREVDRVIHSTKKKGRVRKRKDTSEKPIFDGEVEAAADLSSYANKLARYYAENGIREREALVDAVHADLQEVLPEITRRETMDAISGYGVFTPLSKEEVSVFLRDMRGQMQQLGKIEDMSKGKAPKKTGVERRQPSDTERTLIKEVNEAKKEGGYEVTDPEKQLKTALDAVKTSLRNQIKDLEKQIKTRTKTVKSRKQLALDAEAQKLKRRRDELKKQYDEIFGQRGLTNEQRLARYKSHVRSRIKDYQERLESKDFERREPRKTVLDAEAEKLRFEAEQVRLEFEHALEADRRKHRTTVHAFFGTTEEVLNLARAIVTSMDFSAVLRQGGALVLSHPFIGIGAMKPMFRAFRSEAGASKAIHDLQQRPNAQNGLYKRADLSLTSHTSGQLLEREEVYMSRLSQFLPGIGASERAYVTFLNVLRADVFDSMAGTLAKDGGITDMEAEVLGNLINVATGRGNLGRMAAGARAASVVFFSPRYAYSRFQYILGQPLWHPVKDSKGNVRYAPTKRARKVVIKEYARTLTGLGMFYALVHMAMSAMFDDDDWDVEWDARSSDFGKIRIGKTRIDPLFGLSQTSVLLWRMKTGEMKSASTGKVKPIRGEVKFGSSDAADVLGRFTRYKLSPVVGTAVSLLSGNDPLYRPFGVEDVPINLMVPLSFREIYDAMAEHGFVGGSALGILQIFGMGLQIHNDK